MASGGIGRDVRLIALLYIVFLALAIHGLRSQQSSVPRAAVTVKEVAS